MRSKLNIFRIEKFHRAIVLIEKRTSSELCSRQVCVHDIRSGSSKLLTASAAVLLIYFLQKWHQVFEITNKSVKMRKKWFEICSSVLTIGTAVVFPVTLSLSSDSKRFLPLKRFKRWISEKSQLFICPLHFSNDHRLRYQAHSCNFPLQTLIFGRLSLCRKSNRFEWNWQASQDLLKQTSNLIRRDRRSWVEWKKSHKNRMSWSTEECSVHFSASLSHFRVLFLDYSINLAKYNQFESHSWLAIIETSIQNLYYKC